jgi:hypothetical protein
MNRWIFPSVLMVLMALSVFGMGRKEAKVKRDQAADSTAVTQGIRGKVEIWQGNFMPVTDPQKSQGKILPGAGRRVRVYQPVIVATGMAPARLDSVSSPLVAETICDSLGKFVLKLEPGQYSVFVEDSGGWYANGWNGEGVQGAVNVEADKVRDVTIKITNKATF